MFPPNKVTVLLVVVFIVVSPGLLVMCKKPVLTKEQKDKILKECDKFIHIGYPIYVVSRHSPCCDAVREVVNRDMDYVVIMLTIEEKSKYSIRKIQALHGLCELPAPHHHQQQVMGRRH